MNLKESIEANIELATEFYGKSVVVPPRGQSKNRHGAFWKNIGVNKTNYDAWVSFYTYTQDPGNIQSEWGISPRIPNIDAANAAWATSPDEHARPFIIGLRLGELISTDRTSGTNLFVEVKNGGVFTEFYAEDKVKPQIDASVKDEILSQDEDPDVFLLSLLVEFFHPPKFSWVCKANDILEVATAETIYQVKRKLARQRPYTNSQLAGKKILDIPDHSSWPGGHGYRVGSLARLLFIALAPKITDPKERELFRLRLSLGAWRIAMNREAAGLHWHYDTLVGLQLGESLVDMLLNSVASIPPTATGQSDLLNVRDLIAEMRR